MSDGTAEAVTGEEMRQALHSPVVEVEVSSRRDLARDVIGLEFHRAGGGLLNTWSPGAHVDVEIPNGLVRSYSLVHGEEPTNWSIAVLKEHHSRGGSAWMHQYAQPGTRLRLRQPRNHFNLEPAEKYVFVAGGIGITPLLSMITEARRREQPWELHYSGRDEESLPYVRELVSDPNVRMHLSNRDGRINLGELVTKLPRSCLVYVCGPSRMLGELSSLLPSSDGRLRTERFFGDGLIEDTGSEFSVECAQSRTKVQVSSDDSILAALARVGIEVPSSCEEGVCGSCETAVLAGEPDHRDFVLSDDERKANGTMMICVGRSFSKALVLDI